MPQGGDAKNVCDKITVMAATVRKFRKAIGKPGITPGNIDAELGLALDEVLAGHKINDTPRRFDIDKL